LEGQQFCIGQIAIIVQISHAEDAAEGPLCLNRQSIVLYIVNRLYGKQDGMLSLLKDIGNVEQSLGTTFDTLPYKGIPLQ